MLLPLHKICSFDRPTVQAIKIFMPDSHGNTRDITVTDFFKIFACPKMNDKLHSFLRELWPFLATKVSWRTSRSVHRNAVYSKQRLPYNTKQVT